MNDARDIINAVSLLHFTSKFSRFWCGHAFEQFGKHLWPQGCDFDTIFRTKKIKKKRTHEITMHNIYTLNFFYTVRYMRGTQCIGHVSLIETKIKDA